MLFSFKKIWSLTSLLTILCHQIQGVPIWGHHVSYRVSQKEVIQVRGVSGQGRQCGDTNYDPYHISHTLLVTGLSPVKRNISENISAPLSCDSSQCLVRPHHTGHQDTEQSMWNIIWNHMILEYLVWLFIKNIQDLQAMVITFYIVLDFNDVSGCSCPVYNILAAHCWSLVGTTHGCMNCLLLRPGLGQ